MSSVAESLRREFDATFAAPAEIYSDDWEALLLIRVGERPYALRVRELGGTAAGQRITPVPSSNRALLGLAGIRGTIVPVFDLALLLGEPRSEATRWVAVSSGQEPVALAFAELEGHLKLTRRELGTIVCSEERWVSEIIQSENGLRPVLKVQALVDSVRRTAALELQEKDG